MFTDIPIEITPQYKGIKIGDKFIEKEGVEWVVVGVNDGITIRYGKWDLNINDFDNAVYAYIKNKGIHYRFSLDEIVMINKIIEKLRKE